MTFKHATGSHYKTTILQIQYNILINKSFSAKPYHCLSLQVRPQSNARFLLHNGDTAMASL